MAATLTLSLSLSLSFDLDLDLDLDLDRSIENGVVYSTFENAVHLKQRKKEDITYPINSYNIYDSFSCIMCLNTYFTYLSISTSTKYWPPLAHDNWKRIKTIYELVFDRGDSNIECFKRATKNYGLWQPVLSQISDEEKRFMSLWSLTANDNGRLGVHVPWLSQCWPKSLLFSNSYMFVCYFMHHNKASIFTPVFKTSLVQVFCCLLVTNLAALRWTILSWSISPLSKGSQAELAYSRYGLTRD